MDEKHYRCPEHGIILNKSGEPAVAQDIVIGDNDPVQMGIVCGLCGTPLVYAGSIPRSLTGGKTHG